MVKLKYTKSISDSDETVSGSKYPAMKEIFEKEKWVLPLPKVGEIVEGTIIERKSNALFLDISGLGTGIIYGLEYMEAKNLLRNKKIGDKLFAKIVDLENDESYVELSVKEAGKELAWKILAEKKESGELTEAKISGANRGGLTCEIEGIPAFLPVSQLSLANYPKVENGDPAKILEELRKFIGKNLQIKILDLNPSEEKLIITEKASGTSADQQKSLENFKVGDIVSGEITGIVDFGAFITFSSSAPDSSDDDELEKIEGLAHISELDWKLVHNPEDIVKVGEKVKAKIIDISNGKVSLSLKALKPDPWQEAEKKYKKGDVISGEVLKINPFGAFVQLPDGLQGLCHISEFGSRKKMEEVLEPGKRYEFRVILVDAENHKISLGMANPPEERKTL